MTATITQPGLYPSVPSCDYREWPAINPSTIKVLLSKSPRAMKHVMDNGGDEPTDAMELGTAEHVAIFQPDLFDQRYAVWLGLTRRGKEWDAFLSACDVAGKLPIKADDHRACLMMRDSVHAHPAAKELVRDQVGNELSIVWTDPGTGLLCKGRADRVQGDKLVDLKTARDISAWRFGNQVDALLYYVSMAAYIEGLGHNGVEIKEAVFIAVENVPTYDVCTYPLSPAYIRLGRQKWHEGLQRAKWCLDHNEWPGYSAEPILLDPKPWQAQGESDDVPDAAT